MEVRTPEHLLTPERNCKEEGVSKPHRHRYEDTASEKHKITGGKISRHKHKHHKHKHRKKHRKGHAEASADEIGSDRGDCGSVDPTENPPTKRMELADAQIMKDDSVVMEEERDGRGGEGDMLDEALQRFEHLEVGLPEIVKRHATDDEMEEGEILDEVDVNQKVASSDMESGEIDGGNDLCLLEGYVAENLNSGSSSRDHKEPDEDAGKALFGVALGIAEAYDSEQKSDGVQENVKRRPKANRNSQSKVEVSSPEKYENLHSLHLQGSDFADYANAKSQRRKWTRSPESTKDEPSLRRLQSPFQESEIEMHRGNHREDLYHCRSSRRKSHTTTRRSLSRESDRKDQNRLRSFEERKSSPRPVESLEANCSRRSRSRSREHAVHSCHRDDNCERADQAESRELIHKHGYKTGCIVAHNQGRRSRSREYEDSYVKSVRGRRSKSRETGCDQADRGRRSDQKRRSRSREAAWGSRYSKESISRESERVRRSTSRESEHFSRHVKDGSRRSEHGRRSMSRDMTHDSRYARNDLDRSNRDRRSRSREGLCGSRHTADNSSKRSRGQESTYDLQDNRQTRYDWRHSRSKDGGRQDYSERRRRSLSRSGRDSLVRRRSSRSRSRGGYGEHVDGRRHAKSKENSRDHRMTDQSFGRHAQGEGCTDRERAEYQHLRDRDTTKREEDNQEDYQDSATLQSEEEDIEKEVEKIRMRRQAILEKHRRQEQAERLRNSDLNTSFDANLGTSDSTGDAKLSLDDNASVISGYAYNLGKDSLQNGSLDKQSGTRGLGEGTPKSEEKSNDMFNDFIFGESPAGGRKLVKGDGLALETSGLNDNWDDAEGYYCHHIGELLDGHFEVAASHGRGVFSTVVRARDLKSNRKDGEEVAIKIIRNNDVMLKSGQQELSILKKLDGADPENRRHCVRFFTSFDYRKHLCLVFESMHMNLREVLKKFGRNIGLNLGAVRAYAKQLFIALKHLRNCGVLHCDIKPDNMLVNEAKNVLKLCDFGSAMFAGENEITPYLVSRFYRAPEIILGLPYDHPLDMWSVGCCLYEFFTGKVLFPGPTNNDMLRLHMELKGPFPKKMLKKASFVSKHFDQDYNFCAVEEDPVTKASIKRVLVNVKQKDIVSLVTGQGTSDENSKMLGNFKDLLDKIFMLDPEKRLTVSQALSHPFITGK